MGMTTLDWLILLFVLTLGLFGLRQGFIVGVLSFGGFAIGAFIGTRLGPLLLPQGSASPYAPAFGLVGALLAGAILATGLEGVGWRLRRTTLLVPGVGLLDRTLGALLSAAVGLGVVWIVAAVAAQIPTATQLRADIQRSVILGELNVLLPPSGPILNALARLDPIPSLPGPLPALTAPPPRVAHDPAVLAASRSVVRVLGTACGLAIEGSGWVARPEEVLTNAHVVAGESDTTVEVEGRPPGLAAQAIAFDPTYDLAVLRVPGLDLPTLSLAPNPAAGTAGAILGYPENGPFDVQSGRIGRHRAGAHPERLRPGARCRACSRRCAGWCAPATPGGRWWTIGDGAHHRVRRHHGGRAARWVRRRQRHGPSRAELARAGRD